MKKRIAYRKLGRTGAHKWSMLRNMVSSLIEHERIVTTVPKAKELRPLAEQMITLAKAHHVKNSNKNDTTIPNDVSHRRRAASIVRGAWNVTKLFDVLGPRYQYREGGYTRILPLARPRAGDNAPLAMMEYIDRPGEYKAARPPKALQDSIVMKGLEQALKDFGIPLVDDLITEDEKKAMESKLKEGK